MVQQDLQSPILVLGGSHVQWCPKRTDCIHINTLGQQKSYSLSMPWRHNQMTEHSKSNTTSEPRDTQMISSSIKLRNSTFLCWIMQRR